MNKVILLTLIIFLNLLNASTSKIEVVTENYPPFQWKNQQNITGPSTDVVKALLHKVGYTYSLDIYPWARAYKIAQSRKNVMIYSITRTREREKLFKWIDTIASHHVYFWKLKSRKDIQIKILSDAKKYIISGVRKDAKTQYLLNNGFKQNLKTGIVHSTDISIKLLFSNKVELLVENEDLILQAQKLGYDVSLLEKAYYLKGFSQDLYIALSLMTDDSLVDRFKKVLEELKLSGEFDRIINKYKK